MQIIATIYIGYRIITDSATFEVVGNCKMRKRYKYIVRNLATKELRTIERNDLLQAQREGSAKVVL